MFTKSLRFSATGGEKTAVGMPAPMHGILEGVTIRQVTGTQVAFDFKIFTRRGAIASEIDLNVSGGTVVGITQYESSGKCLVETEEAHALSVGDEVEVKGCDVAGYNYLPDQVTHTVTLVIDETTFVTSVNYSSDGTGGLWQTTPERNETLDPAMFELYSAAVSSGGTHRTNGQEITYQNMDAQLQTSRRRSTWLWLEIDPEGTGDKSFEISYVVQKYSD